MIPVPSNLGGYLFFQNLSIGVHDDEAHLTVCHLATILPLLWSVDWPDLTHTPPPFPGGAADVSDGLIDVDGCGTLCVRFVQRMRRERKLKKIMKKKNKKTSYLPHLACLGYSNFGEDKMEEDVRARERWFTGRMYFCVLDWNELIHVNPSLFQRTC